MFPNLLDSTPRGGELVPSLHVYAQVAGGLNRGASDPDVDLPRSGMLHELHDLLHGGAADNAVVDEDYTLPLDE